MKSFLHRDDHRRVVLRRVLALLLVPRVAHDQHEAGVLHEHQHECQPCGAAYHTTNGGAGAFLPPALRALARREPLKFVNADYSRARLAPG